MGVAPSQIKGELLRHPAHVWSPNEVMITKNSKDTCDSESGSVQISKAATDYTNYTDQICSSVAA
jgi:hypothetical protein